MPTIAPSCVSWPSCSGGSGQAEVEDLHAVRLRLQPDVGRLDVAVDQPALVGRRQSPRHLPADAEHLGQRELALALQSRVERLAFEELHGQEGHAAILADLVDGDDVVVLDRRRGSGLAQEALPGPSRAASAGSIALRATIRSRCGSSARKTTPMPPNPSTCRTR